MNRGAVVFGIVACFCSLVLADSTNIVGGGSVDLSGFQFSGSGDFPNNYAAFVVGATSLQISGSSFDGGAGGIATGSAQRLDESGGCGLLFDTDSAVISNSSFNGGIGGSITSQVCQLSQVNGGYGIYSEEFNVVFGNGMVAIGGNAGTVDNETGQAKARGGDGLLLAVHDVSGSLTLPSGLYQGGNGGHANFNSSEKEDNYLMGIHGRLNGAQGGHGLSLLQTDMFREAFRSVRIEGGAFLGGDGGAAMNSDPSGDVVANGGSGVLIGSVSDVEILGGTFVGARAGSANGLPAEGGYGATFWDSNVEVSGGDFQGDGGDILFGSLFYDSICTIGTGSYNRVVFRALDPRVSGWYQGKVVANISAGDFGEICFSGEYGIDAAFSGGTVSNICFEGTGTTHISTADEVLRGSEFVQKDGNVFCSSNLLTGGHFLLEKGTLTVTNGLPPVAGAVDIASAEIAFLSVPQAGYNFSPATDSGAVTFRGETVSFSEGIWQTNSTEGSSLLWMGPYPISATVAPTQLVVEAALGNNPAPEQLQIQYGGRFSTTCTVSSDVPWMAVSPESILCTNGQEWVVELQFDADELVDGDYAGHVVIMSEDAEVPLQAVEVSLHIPTPETIYVSPSGSDANLGTSWTQAKATIQSGVDAVAVGGTVWVTNGIYNLASEIKITKNITIQSVNGPEVTIVDGGGSHRCLNLGSSACTIGGFTVRNGYSSGYSDKKYGGGIYCANTSPVVTNCVISANYAYSGGGVSGGTLLDCIVIGNEARYNGGGLYNGTANNCAIVGNQAEESGGGIRDVQASNCTITYNKAKYGGGTHVYYSGALHNCIVWHNTDLYGQKSNIYNWSASDVKFSCSDYLREGEDGNTRRNPRLVSASHIAPSSPCRGTGSALYASGADIDGDAWVDPPSMGCDEPNDPLVSAGSLYPFLSDLPETFVEKTAVSFQALVVGQLSDFRVDFGDGQSASNQVDVSHAWSAPGSYDVVLTAWNDDHLGGVSVTQQVQVLSMEESAIYVSESGNDYNDGKSWATAKRTIQRGVDAQTIYGGTVWVSNGTYVLSSTIKIKKPIVVRSVNGAGATIVDGIRQTQCFILAGKCRLNGFTIMRGEYPRGQGGGVYCSGAEFQPIVENCFITGNSAALGGGIARVTAKNCTIVGNSGSSRGGGAYYSILTNCIVQYNISGDGQNIQSPSRATFTCSPDVIQGVDGNITNAPQLISSSHIGVGSPCRGAGDTLYGEGTDVDGEPWLDPPSMGCDEYYETAAMDGSIRLLFTALPNKIIAGVELPFAVSVIGKASAFQVDFGDRLVVPNQFAFSHVWNTPGDYDVVLTAWNDDHPDGVSVTQQVQVVTPEAPAIYVSTSGSDFNNGESWATAKRTIKAGVDAQKLYGGTVWVSNGTYAVAQTIKIDKPIVVKSLSGADATVVDGDGSVRCFNLENNCRISGFTVRNGYTTSSGGAIYCRDTAPVIENCVIVGNRCKRGGGGVEKGTVVHCTVTGNSANYGGGLSRSVVNNSIVFYNTSTSSNDLYDCTASHTCSLDVAHGMNGNITNAPQLISSSHIDADSPCRGAGDPLSSDGVDVDGEPWLDPPSMGCDEYYETTVMNGSIHLLFSGLSEKLVEGVEMPFSVSVIGKVSAFQVDLGDGQIVSNQLGISHAWNSTGTFDVVLTAWNDDYPDGFSITQQVQVLSLEDAAIYVAPSGNDSNDGKSWATAKATIQGGVDAQVVYGGTVWVSNGTYAVVAAIKINKPIVVQSVNGAASTIVDGGGSSLCFNPGGSACTISGFTIQHGDSYNGGGVYCSDTTPVVENCVITANSASFGAGMFQGTANNCTFTGNSASFGGGGMCRGVANNCIVWHNTALFGSDLFASTANHTCSPEVSHGINGNMTNAPLLVSSSRIADDSPCRSAGSGFYSRGMDVDGEVWLSPPSIGCDEVYETSSVTGLLEVVIAGSTNTVVDRPVEFFANIQGRTTGHVWNFGDGTGATNNLSPTNVWDAPGYYAVVLTAFNDTYPEGVSATQVLEVVSSSESAVYVSVQTGNDENDGSSWATAKASIQAGVDAQIYEGGIVWVSNGIYNLTAEIFADRGIVIKSTGGRDLTIVDGGGTTRCFNLGGTLSTLDGFTVRNGYALGLGGGIYCSGRMISIENCMISNNEGCGLYGGTARNCIIINNSTKNWGGGLNEASAYNCIITNNSAARAGGMDLAYGDPSDGTTGVADHCLIAGNTATESGGGVRGGIVRNCLIINNHAAETGGGTLDTMAINCTICDNVADNDGGGSYKTILRSDCNTIVYYNTAPEHADLYSIDPTTNCCASDILQGVDGGITAEPMFVDRFAGNYQLQSNSPCINWGSNAAISESMDLADNPRIVESHVDMGCYEYQGILGLADSDGDGLPDDWERGYFGGNVLPEDNLDGDSSPNGDEFIAGTDPTNGASYFHVATDALEGGFVIEWTAVTGRVYNVYWKPSLTQAFHPLETGIAYPQHSYTDTVHAAESSGFYRVVVMRADYDADGDGLPNDWEAQYAVADASADNDGDGFDNLSEFIAGTDPTNGTSFFATANSLAEVEGTSYFVVEWVSIPDRLYSVQWSTNLVDGFQTLEDDIAYPQHSYTDTTHGAESEGFYKVDVRLK